MKRDFQGGERGQLGQITLRVKVGNCGVGSVFVGGGSEE